MAIKKEFAAVPEKALILGADKYFSLDGKKTHVNNNVLIVGRSGSGKTRYFVEPNLLQCNGSYVISDPKGALRKKYEPYFKEMGYEVLVMDFIHPAKSARYNPFCKLHSTDDVKKMAHILTYNTDYKKGSYDPYWDHTSEMLFMGLIGYMYETKKIPECEKTITKFMELADMCNRERGLGINRCGERESSPMSGLLAEHNDEMLESGKMSWAKRQFDKVDSAPTKTYQTILSTMYARLSGFDSEELLTLLSSDDLDFKTIGMRPTVLFVEVSDTDRSMDKVVNLFYTQLMNELCMYADDECPDSCLPVPVQFILDDFATNCRIDNFENMISNIRSRGISAILMIQSESQLSTGYGEAAQTIIDNCASYLYLGGTNYQTADVVAKRANKPTHEILNMPVDSGWLFRVGQEPARVDFLELDVFLEQKGCIPFEKPAFSKGMQVLNGGAKGYDRAG